MSFPLLGETDDRVALRLALHLALVVSSSLGRYVVGVQLMKLRLSTSEGITWQAHLFWKKLMHGLGSWVRCSLANFHWVSVCSACIWQAFCYVTRCTCIWSELPQDGRICCMVLLAHGASVISSEAPQLEVCWCCGHQTFPIGSQPQSCRFFL